MKGTPVGNGRRRRGARVAVGTAAVAATLATGAATADAKTFEVTNTNGKGRGSFAAAIDGADRHRGADRIEFAKRLRGPIEVSKGLRIEGKLTVEGPGYGNPDSKRFGRVRLESKSGSRIDIAGGEVRLRGLYLERIGISAVDSDLSVRDSYLQSDDSAPLTGLDLQEFGEANLKVQRSTITGYGQGISVSHGDARIDRSTISDNSPGGGISSGDYSGLQITNSTISGNRLETQYPDHGAGIRATYYGTGTVTNSTVARNVSTGTDSVGGGVYGDLEVLNSTIAGNTAGTGGGVAGVAEHIEPIEVTNSIVSGNRDATGAPSDCGTPFVSKGGNLITAPGGCELDSGDLAGVDPELGTLNRYNGGPTRTMALPKGSPAIGLAVKKTATKFDQRGVKRGKDPDAGAYERKG
jgi:hypothetical protein